MSGQMCWLSSSNNEDQLILHLRERSFDSWLPYTTCTHYKVPDYLIPGGSKGWSTYQHLRQAGWTVIPTAQAQNTVARSEAQWVRNS
jgi:hypothetical protein